jgi:hypothetical protein
MAAFNSGECVLPTSAFFPQSDEKACVYSCALASNKKPVSDRGYRTGKADTTVSGKALTTAMLDLLRTYIISINHSDIQPEGEEVNCIDTGKNQLCGKEDPVRQS